VFQLVEISLMSRFDFRPMRCMALAMLMCPGGVFAGRAESVRSIGEPGISPLQHVITPLRASPHRAGRLAPPTSATHPHSESGGEFSGSR
jgi:hypothetical protein